MKKRIFIFIPISLILIQCAATLTDRGSHVQTVTEEQRDCCCTFITVVATGERFNPSPGERAQSAMNQARNQVANLGGNAMRILDIEASRDEVMVVVEALVCDPQVYNEDDTPEKIGLGEISPK
ncbi:hypothetical protein HQ585_08550 [candidate division KSB1 bacterium]|nr:hypothetical protein [candidate division KSB1 bacterium]